MGVVRQLVPSGTTGQRAIKSSVWLVAQNVLGRGLQLVMLLILGNLIGPRALGLVGIALLTFSALDEFTTMGLREALVQREATNVDEFLATTWVLQLLRGTVIAGAIWLVAPLVGLAFGEPRAVPLVRAVGLAALAHGLRNPAVIYFQKSLDYHREFLYQTSGAIVQFVVSVGYVLVVPSVWAYVVGYLAGDLTRTVVSYVVHDYRPTLAFDREAAAELIGYGKWITGSSILYFLFSEGDDAFVGWLLGAASLGLYQYAYRFSNAPATELTQVVGRVMFPAYSQLQDDLGQARSAFVRSLRVTGLVAVPMAFGIAVVAPSFVRTTLGADWVPMIPAMQLLAGFGLLRAITKNFSPVWKAFGRPDYVAKMGAVRLGLIVIGIWPATAAFGITGTAALLLGISVFPVFPMDAYLAAKILDARPSRVAVELAYPLIAGTLMAIPAWGVGRALAVSPPVELVAVVLTGLVTYPIAVLMVETLLGWEVRPEIVSFVDGVRS